MSQDQADYRRQATVDAAHWFATMQQKRLGDAEREQFARWLSQSAQHVEEYLKVSAVWRLSAEAAGQHFSKEELIRQARADLATDQVIALDSQRKTASVAIAASANSRASFGAPFRVGMGIAAAVAVVTVAALGWFARVEVADYHTRPGDRLTVSLSDGSTVRLNTDTRLRVRLSRSGRDIQLLDGEALFHAAKDPQRPFRVHCADSEIRALGTSFNVYRRQKVTTITVIDGLVEVAPKAVAVDQVSNAVAALQKPFRLKPREQANIAEDGRLQETQVVDTTPVVAWTQQSLRFFGKPLEAVIEQFNQYNSTHMILETPALAAVQISGVFSSADIESFIQYLEKTEDVKIVRGDAEVRIVSRANEASASL